MSDAERDTERVTVRTYLPAYQREEWDDHAEDLDMSRSEFVRTMVQAGRRGFLDDQSVAESAVESGGSAEIGRGADENGAGAEPNSSEPDDSGESDSDPIGGGLDDRVIEVLAAEGYLSWDELLAAVTDDVERRLESTLQDLQSAGRVTYSGRNGGYTLDE